jgi:hypothetical protein
LLVRKHLEHLILGVGQRAGQREEPSSKITRALPSTADFPNREV